MNSEAHTHQNQLGAGGMLELFTGLVGFNGKFWENEHPHLHIALVGGFVVLFHKILAEENPPRAGNIGNLPCCKQA